MVARATAPGIQCCEGEHCSVCRWGLFPACIGHPWQDMAPVALDANRGVAMATKPHIGWAFPGMCCTAARWTLDRCVPWARRAGELRRRAHAPKGQISGPRNARCRRHESARGQNTALPLGCTPGISGCDIVASKRKPPHRTPAAPVSLSYTKRAISNGHTRHSAAVYIQSATREGRGSPLCCHDMQRHDMTGLRH